MTHEYDEDETYTAEDAEADRLHEIAALKELRTPAYTAAQQAAMDAAEAQYQKHKAEVIAHEERGGPVPTMFRDRYEGLFHPFGEGGPLPPERERPWLVDGLVPATGVVLLAAPPKAGKTDLATAVAYSVAAGTPFAGRATLPGAVLWMNGDEIPAERAHLLAARPVLPNGEPAPLFESAFVVPIEDDEFRPAVASWAQRTGARLLVIDSLRTATHLSLASAKHARGMILRLRNLAHELSMTVLVVHHTRKSAPETTTPHRSHANMGDSPALLSTASAHLHLSSTPHPEAPDERRVVLVAAGRGLHGGRTLLLRSAAPLDYRPEDGRLASPLAGRVLALLTGGEATAEALAARLDVLPGSVRNALTTLVAADLVMRAGTESRARVYALKPDDARARKSASVIRKRPLRSFRRRHPGSIGAAEDHHERHQDGGEVS